VIYENKESGVVEGSSSVSFFFHFFFLLFFSCGRAAAGGGGKNECARSLPFSPALNRLENRRVF